jgi:two-component system response regulator HydG
MDALYYHNWPGNIRELKHCMEKAVILSENAALGPEYFRIGKANSETPTESNKLSEVEKFTVKKVLDKHRGNLTKAAKELGISRTTLYLKIEKHGLKSLLFFDHRKSRPDCFIRAFVLLFCQGG